MYDSQFKRQRLLPLQHENESLWFLVFDVCRQKLPSDGDECLVRIIDDFLNEVSGFISLSRAYKASGGSLQFLQYLASRELPTTDPILHRWEFNNVTGEAAARGDLRTLQWLVESYQPEEILTQVVAAAVGNGHLHILEWLWENHQSRTVWGGIELCLIKESYYPNVIQWLQARTEIFPESAQELLRLAANNGDVKLERVLHASFYLDYKYAVSCAASKSQWEVVFWFADNCPLLHWYSLDLYVGPVESGNLELLQNIFDRGLVRNTENILEFAAKCGQLHIVKWLYKVKGFTEAGNGYIAAVQNGHIGVLEYLNKHKKIKRNSDKYIVDKAKSLKVIQWLQSHTNAKFSHYTMDEAAGRGDLEMVRWFQANSPKGCSTCAMDWAARNGHLDVVKWLHANRTEGCSTSALNEAAVHGHLEIVRWLHANRTEKFRVYSAMDTAASSGNLELLRWFHEHLDKRCTTKAMDSAAWNGHLEIVKWLHRHRTEGCTTNAMDIAAENGHLEVVKWLHFNRSEGCTTHAINKAAANGHIKLVKWLHANRSQKCCSMSFIQEFNWDGRLDLAAYLVSEFPACREFHLGSVEVSRVEVVEWLLAHMPIALEDCDLFVPSWNRRWLPSNGDQRLDRIIDAFLDEVSGLISLSEAYKSSDGSLRFIQYLVSRELPTTDPILHRWEFNTVTGEAAARGDLRTLQWLVERYQPKELLTIVVAAAVGNGHLHILEWLWANHRGRTIWGGIELCLIMESYYPKVVQWLRDRTEISPESAQELLRLAAENGDVELVRVLCKTFELNVEYVMWSAASECQWEVVFWFADNCTGLDQYNFSLYVGPVKSGDLELLQNLFDRGLVLNTKKVLEFAAKCGQLHIVKWLYKVKGFTKAGYGYIAAVQNGHVDILEYLSKHKKIKRYSKKRIMDQARSLETMKWLHFHTDAKCTYRAMDEAAGRGDLEMVRWLHANSPKGCSTCAMDWAARNGHLDVVKWLHANRTEGCSTSALNEAAEHGHLEIVRWLHANRTEKFSVYSAMDTAACGNLEILQWFHENRDGWCTTYAMDSAVANGHLQVVKWLHNHRTEGCTTNTMDKAAENGHLEMVKWLHHNRTEGCTTKAMDKAAENGHLEVVKWLHMNRSEGCTMYAINPPPSHSRVVFDYM